jgi:hypothetical protein
MSAPSLDPAGDPAERRRRDLVERLEWVIRRRLDELPDTLVAALGAAGVDCDRTSAPHAILDRLHGARVPEGRPEVAGRPATAWSAAPPHGVPSRRSA